MKNHDKKFLLAFAIVTIERIEGHVEGISYSAFRRSHIRQDAVLLRLEILGYALRDLLKKSKVMRAKKSLTLAMRICEQVTRDYRVVDTTKIWKTVTLVLPVLKRELSGFQ